MAIMLLTLIHMSDRIGGHVEFQMSTAILHNVWGLIADGVNVKESL